MITLETDVAIVGAGPAGSSLAGFLGLLGHRTVVLEREIFPRFHIGESLLTACVPRLEALGLDLASEPYAKRKPGALFVHEPSGESFRIDFSRALAGTFPYAYQVERQHFDHALAKRAAALGADVRYGAEVTSWRTDDHGVEIEGGFGNVHARFMIDATGQQAIVGRRRRTIEPLHRFGRCASFSTYGGVTSALAHEQVGDGDIVIVLVDDGWMWLIPLPGERVSVGIVERTPRAGTTAESILRGCIEGSGYLSAFFAGASPIAPFRRIANYSYDNLEPSSPRVAAVGDARAFLDPIFSSGVTIAVATADLLAGEISRALGTNSGLELDEYHRTCSRAYTTFDRLIERFYRPEWVRNVFFSSRDNDRIVREFTSILAGDVWREDNIVQKHLLAAQPRTRSQTSRATT